MVGVPADYNNYKDVKKLDDIFVDLGVGNVIVNGYNYFNPGKYDDVTFLNAVIEFNNGIQERAIKSKLALPLLIATDFESPNFTSIRNGLILPPSALAIGVSQNKELTTLVGELVGLELSNIGIHVLLGPVLDSYNIKQGNRSTLQDRCFASTPRGVISISSHFIRGLKNGGVSLFVKHFPSYGMVEENPHDLVIPQYEGPLEQMDSEIRSFSEYYRDTLDGIMTSHLLLKRLSNNMATFSPEFIKYHLRDAGFYRQIIITDDLTSMGAIKKYRQSSQETFGAIAVKAFAAGHDILLFSHFSEIDRRSQFSITDLISVRNALIKYIKGSASAEKHFREALVKVIYLKARMARGLGYKVEEIINNYNQLSFFNIQHGGKEALNKSQAFLKSYDNTFNDGEKLVREIIRKAATLINKSTHGANYDLNALPNTAKIVVYAYAEGLNRFQEAIQSLYTKSEFITIPPQKDSTEFRRLRENSAVNFSKADVVIYTVFDRSDSDLLSVLRKQDKSFSEKVIILCHNSPIILDNEMLTEATIISTFTNHPFSYDIDLEILLHKLKPKELQNLPISLGENGKIYNVATTTFIEPTNIAAYENLFPKYLADKRTITIIRSENYLIPKAPMKKYLFVILNFGVIFFTFIVFGKDLKPLRERIKEQDFFVSQNQVCFSFFLKRPWHFLPVICLIIIDIVFFRQETVLVKEAFKHLTSF
jgi:beta-glucosidase-like glycosyl hydrolase